MTKSTLPEIRERDRGHFTWKDDAYTAQAVMDRCSLLGILDEIAIDLEKIRARIIGAGNSLPITQNKVFGMQIVMNPGVPPSELHFVDHNGKFLGKIVGISPTVTGKP